MQHSFIEFKWRFFYIFINYFLNFSIILIFNKEFLYIFLKPNLNTIVPNFIFTQINEIFWVFYKLSLCGGFFCLFPFFFIQLWFFLIPGLHQHEFTIFNKFFISFFICKFFLFFLFWFYMFPFLCKFFLTFEQKGYSNLIHIFYEGKLQEYLDLTLTLFFYILIIFYFFLGLFIWCINLNLIQLYKLFLKRKYIYILMLILNLMVVYDIVSFMFINIISFFLFELFLFILFLNKLYKNPFIDE